MAASVVYLSNVDVDRPMSKAAWNNSHALRHFSILRKLDGVAFPAGDPSSPVLHCTDLQHVSRHRSVCCHPSAGTPEVLKSCAPGQFILSHMSAYQMPLMMLIAI